MIPEDGTNAGWRLTQRTLSPEARPFSAALVDDPHVAFGANPRVNQRARR
jgi:hypothetical protein